MYCHIKSFLCSVVIGKQSVKCQKSKPKTWQTRFLLAACKLLCLQKKERSVSPQSLCFNGTSDWVCLLCIFRLYRLWRTTTRKCCLSTETTDLLAWLLRILSLPSATYLPTSPPMRSNWAGTAKTWPHTSTCCLRPLGSSGLRHSTCPASLLCLVMSSAVKHILLTQYQTYMPRFSLSLAYWNVFPYVGVVFWHLALSIVLVRWHSKHLKAFMSCRKSYTAWWGPGCLPLESTWTRTPTSFSQGTICFCVQSYANHRQHLL